MSEPFPLLPPPSANSNPNSNPSYTPLQWPELALSWLSSLPTPPSAGDVDSWIDSNLHSLPEEILSLPRPDLHYQILALHNPLQVSFPLSDPLHPYRFQRTDQWKPVYSWLESLDSDRLVNSKEIKEWLDSNPKVYEMLLVKHSKYHLMHYIQRLHLKVLKKKGKVHKGVQLSTARASLKNANGIVTTHAVPLQCKSPGNSLKDSEMFLNKKSDAFLRYELLTDLQTQLTCILCKSTNDVDLKKSTSSLSEKLPGDNIGYLPSDVGKNPQATRTSAPNSEDVVSIHVIQHSTPRLSLHKTGGQKCKMDSAIALPAWASCEAVSGASRTDQSESSCFGEVASEDIMREHACSSVSQKTFSRKNIAICLQGREKGISWRLACSHSAYAGRNREAWSPFFRGWRSLDRQFEGPSLWYERRRYSSWIPTWCAYISSVAVAQPHVRQGVQKVLDVRFHPEGLPQLVCCCNEVPNELLLYNLLSGRAVQLSGHNCQIQAVEFAVRGASVVSCGANLMKVWDCTTGSCLFTLGSVDEDRALVGHSKKINAMTVNSWQSCLVVTSGGDGDGKLLLWNALRGELASDLNVNLRTKDEGLPSIDAMKFCSENILVCGSDCSHGGPAVVQLWDLESPHSCFSFPTHDSFITSLEINPGCNTIITGAGDGTVGLFDIRTCDAIAHLSVGSLHEVTSVSFSSCGTYFSAASTLNKTMVWDTRLMPMNRRQMPLGKSSQGPDKRFLRPLHCLSHGRQMPTADQSSQLPGHVDEGNQGVNDACWLHKEPVLVTVSGDGSIAMWDVTLGQPCVRHLLSHTRCANTVTVSANDEYLCSGGDDQKVVLYNNTRQRRPQKWRLSHPISEAN